MNTEKIEKLKKGLTNSQIPESLREKIRQQISRLEAEDNAFKPAPKKEPTPPVAKAPTVRKPRAKKVVAKKTVAPKKVVVGKTTAMSLAKEIRKDGEKWTDAVKRAGTQMKKGTTEVKKTTKTEMQKLLSLVKRKKELKGISGTNLKRDAHRTALPKGKRLSANGKVYYENRDNRTDRLAPNYPKNSPLLEVGGFVSKYVKVNFVQGNYGNGWEDLTAHDTFKEAKKERIVYDKNEKNYPHRVIERRVLRSNYEKGNYELGGTVVTDLAGHTSGGDGGLNANMPLNGFSNTAYTGQVGETGAMSSGEMFAKGGGIGMKAQQGQINDLKKYIPNANKENIEILAEAGNDNGETFRGNFIAKYGKQNFRIEDGKLVRKFELGGGLPSGAEQSYVNYYLGEGTAQGIYKNGGSIPNNYEGRNAKDVWNNLSTSQRHHFLHDHNKSEIQSTPMSIEDFTKKSYNFLPTKVKKSFENHVRTGQYANGGGLGKAHYISNRDISGLTTKTGQRLKVSDLLDGAYTNKDIKTPKMSRTQFEDESYEYKNGGMFGGRTYQKGQPLINDRKHINASEKHELNYAGKHPNPKRGHYSKMKMSRTQFEDDTYDFEGGGSIDDANFSKFINAQVNHIISLKSVAQKKEPIRNLISNMDDYKGSDMLKRITTDNFKYALQQNTPSKINQVLRTSLNALKFDGGGSFEKPFNVLYKTKSGGTMVASRIMAKTEDEAKQKLIKQMSASNTFDKVLMVHESFENGGGFQSGVYLKGGNLALIKEQYEENEDDNAHSENVVLLAKHFGSSDELKEAKKILALHNKQGNLTDENQSNRKALSKKLIERATKEMLKQNIKFAGGGKLESGSINALSDLWFAVQQKDTDDYKMLSNNLDKLKVPFVIQNEVSADAETQRGRKALNIPEVHDRIKKIVEKNSRKFNDGGDLGIEEEIDLTDDNRLRVKELTYEYKKPTAKELAEKHNSGAYEFMDKDKMMAGGKTKQGNKGEAMQLAKQIRKDGEKWTDAVKRAWLQLK